MIFDTLVLCKNFIFIFNIVQLRKIILCVPNLNQLWNIVAPRCIAEHRGFRWGVRRDTSNSAQGSSKVPSVGLKTFKGCQFLPNIDFGDEVIGGRTSVEGQEPDVLPDGIEYYARERVDEYPIIP